MSNISFWNLQIIEIIYLFDCVFRPFCVCTLLISSLFHDPIPLHINSNRQAIHWLFARSHEESITTNSIISLIINKNHNKEMESVIIPPCYWPYLISSNLHSKPRWCIIQNKNRTSKRIIITENEEIALFSANAGAWHCKCFSLQLKVLCVNYPSKNKHSSFLHC